MRIHLTTDGGFAVFPGLAQRQTVDTANLSAEDAEPIEQLVQSVGFFELPQRVGTIPPGARDMRQHTLTVEDSERTHTVTIAEPVSHEALKHLIQLVRSHTTAVGH